MGSRPLAMILFQGEPAQRHLLRQRIAADRLEPRVMSLCAEQAAQLIDVTPEDAWLPSPFPSSRDLLETLACEHEHLVQPIDRHSTNSLMPPTPEVVAKLAHLLRQMPAEMCAKEKQPPKPRSLRRRLTPQVIEELVARYTAGEKTPALSQAFGISESGLRDLLRAEGVSLRGHPIMPEDTEQAVQLYARGFTITAVAAQLGYAHGTIRSALLKRGIALRPGSRGKQVTPSQ